MRARTVGRERREQLRELGLAADEQQAGGAAEPLKSGEEEIDAFARDHLSAEEKDDLAIVRARRGAARKGARSQW